MGDSEKGEADQHELRSCPTAIVTHWWLLTCADVLFGTHSVGTRVAQRLLALAAAVWHNWATNPTNKRSLTAYDH